MSAFRVIAAVTLSALSAMSVGILPVSALGRCRGMSIREMIGLRRFENERGRTSAGVLLSPDGKYAVTVSRRGELAPGLVIDKLMIWNIAAVHRWLQGRGARPAPMVEVTQGASGKFELPAEVISHVTWYGRSDRVLFLGAQRGESGRSLFEVGPRQRLKRLSMRGQQVWNFSTRGAEIVYEVAVSTGDELGVAVKRENKRPFLVATGSTLPHLLFPTAYRWGAVDAVALWRIVRGERSPVRLSSSGRWKATDDFSRHLLSMSPDGKTVLMDLPVRDVPHGWTRYGSAGIPMWPGVGPVSGEGTPGKGWNVWVPHQYVFIDLETGRMRAAVAAPDGPSRGFWFVRGDSAAGRVSAKWAHDGAAVLIGDTFISTQRSGPSQIPMRGIKAPCAAVVNVASGRVVCLDALSDRRNKILAAARWLPTASDRLAAVWRRGATLTERQYCVDVASARWIKPCSPVWRRRIDTGKVETRLWVAQSLNSPPALIAALSKGAQKVLYDPNAGLRRTCLGTAETIALDVGVRRKAFAGLLLPIDHRDGRRYPLVIQTHGYDPARFLSTGYSVPFAARALAAAGIAVMQLPMCYQRADGQVVIGTPAEIPCDVKVFRSAIRYGVQHGFADPKKIGIIGFSATCEEVLAALETFGMHFAAAEVVDGLMGTYSQYIDGVGVAQGYPNAFEAARFGGAPIGSPLSGWVAGSPGFSVNEIRSPLMIQSNGRDGLLGMWEPYAILHHLHRPVDLIAIQKGTHPFSNPRQQYASLQLTVDWFRFWLQNRRPVSGAEYRRWYRMSALEKSGGS